MKDLVNMDAIEFTEIVPHTERLGMSGAFAQDGDISQLQEPDKESVAEAKAMAESYAKAVNSNARSRNYLVSDEDAKDGVASALDWLKRKKRSALKN